MNCNIVEMSSTDALLIILSAGLLILIIFLLADSQVIKGNEACFHCVMYVNAMPVLGMTGN